MLAAFTMAAGGIVASRRLHTSLVLAVFSAALAVYDVTPCARFITRCADDMSDIDLVMPFTLRGLLNAVLMTSATLLVLCLTSRLVLAAAVPLTVIYISVQVSRDSLRGSDVMTRAGDRRVTHIIYVSV